MMFSAIILIIIGGTLFFLGAYGAISMQKAAQHIAARNSVDQSDVMTSSQHAKSSPVPFIASLIVLTILLCIPTSYSRTASLSFAAGIIFAIIVFVFQKIRVSFS